MGRNVLALAVTAALAVGICWANDAPSAPGVPKENEPSPGWTEDWIKKHCTHQEETPTPAPKQQDQQAPSPGPTSGPTVQPVPEPASAALLMLGAAALLSRRRGRQADRE